MLPEARVKATMLLEVRRWRIKTSIPDGPSMAPTRREVAKARDEEPSRAASIRAPERLVGEVRGTRRTKRTCGVVLRIGGTRLRRVLAPTTAVLRELGAAAGEAKLVERLLRETSLGREKQCRRAGIRSERLLEAVVVARVAPRPSTRRARKCQKLEEVVAGEEPKSRPRSLRIHVERREAEAAPRAVVNPAERYTGRRFLIRLRELGLGCKEICRKAFQEESSHNTT
jgi:hypothetical protein